MSDEWQKYVDDSRTVCKYGIKCYQKNPDHHKKFKHPPKNMKRKQNGNHLFGNPTKKRLSEDREVTKISPEKVKDRPGPSVADASPSPAPSEEHTNAIISIPEPITYLSCTEANRESKIQKLFLMEMPSDFYKFYDCLVADKDDFVKTLANVNLELVGPYDLLLGKLPVVDEELYLVHGRFFYDPPEFQTVLKAKGKGEYHIGYYHDSPDEMPVFLGSNDSSKDCTITPLAQTIFGAVYLYLQNEKKKSPFTSMACQKVMDKVKKWAEENNFTLDQYQMKARSSKICTKTLHGAGIVVPYDKKTELGYRPLVESYATIKKIFKNLESSTTQSEKDKYLSELQPVITYANIAVDECDFGTGLECGINLFCSGIRDLEASALSCLCPAYSLLKRDAFVKIIQAHLKYRRKGPNMSILSS